MNRLRKIYTFVYCKYVRQTHDMPKFMLHLIYDETIYSINDQQQDVPRICRFRLALATHNEFT